MQRNSGGAAGDDYQAMWQISLFRIGRLYLTIQENDWYLKSGFTAAADVMESLEKRRWAIAVSNEGDFIASDNPVVMDAPAGGRRWGLRMRLWWSIPSADGLSSMGTN